MNQGKNRKGVGVVIPTAYRDTHLSWAFAFKGLDGPINWHTMWHIVENKPVDQARIEGVTWSLQNNAKYTFFLGDDTIPPSNALQNLIWYMENHPEINVISGCYWCKADPTFPLMFPGAGEGSYWNWKLGEVVRVWGTGMDCTLIRNDVFDRIEKPWFLTAKANASIDGLQRAEAWTEDLYFCEKLARLGGGKLKGGVYVDTSIQCKHYDANSKRMFEMPPDCLPARRQFAVGDKRILDLGCGGSDVVLKDGIPVRVDLREDINVDYRCDVRKLPFMTESWDIVFSMATLERYSQAQIPGVLDEWLRVLKPKGELKLIVADLESMARGIVKGKVDLNMLYGGQDQPHNVRRTGFTPSTLRKVLESKGLKVKKIWQEAPHWIFSQSIKEKARTVIGDFEGQGILKETGKMTASDEAAVTGSRKLFDVRRSKSKKLKKKAA